ncbi:MAG: MCE family protein [Deltaproteobacteria bacterium]|nr:MCE family protein [Deltaproteobacteria bacterium]
MADGRTTLPSVAQSRGVPGGRARLSVVWIIPIVAAATGLWVAVTRILSEGPDITITFSSAEGLEAGKTKIRYKGVDLGTVNTIRLSGDHLRVIASSDGTQDRGFPGRGYAVLGGQTAHLRSKHHGT